MPSRVWRVLFLQSLEEIDDEFWNKVHRFPTSRAMPWNNVVQLYIDCSEGEYNDYTTQLCSVPSSLQRFNNENEIFLVGCSMGGTNSLVSRE